MTSDNDRESKSKKFHDEIPLAEWIVAACGGVLILASFGFLTYRAVSERRPPSFAYTVENVDPMDDKYAAIVSIHNRGGRPVANVSLRAVSDRNEQCVVVVDFVPANSSRRVTFLFDNAIIASDLTFKVDSFSEP